MGYPDTYSTKSDPKAPVVSVSTDSRRYVNRAARLGHDLPDGWTMRPTDRGAAVQYCISNDLV